MCSSVWASALTGYREDRCFHRKFCLKCQPGGLAHLYRLCGSWLTRVREGNRLNSGGEGFSFDTRVFAKSVMKPLLDKAGSPGAGAFDGPGHGEEMAIGNSVSGDSSHNVPLPSCLQSRFVFALLLFCCAKGSMWNLGPTHVLGKQTCCPTECHTQPTCFMFDKMNLDRGQFPRCQEFTCGLLL